MKNLLKACFSVFIIIHSLKGQEIKLVITYPSNPVYTDFYYNSDSVILVNTLEKPAFINSLKKLESINKPGKFFTSPSGKQYFISADGKWFSTLDPVKHTLVNTMDNFIYPSKQVEHFEVVNDKYIILKFVDDTLIFKIDFYANNTIKQNLFMRLSADEREASIHKLNDSTFYVSTKLGLYLKKINTNHLDIVKSPRIGAGLGVYKFYCKNNIAVIATYANISVSTEHGANFKIVYVSSVFNGIEPRSILIQDNEIWFNEYTTFAKSDITLYKMDVKGKKTKILTHGNLLSQLTTKYKNLSCDHHDTLPAIHWIDTANWLVKSGEGDFYKIAIRKRTVKYLGGSYILGVNYMKVSEGGNYLFHSTGNKLLSFSNDTGKTWTLPQSVSTNSSVKKVEFKNKSVYILRGNKICLYHYDKKELDTALFKIDIPIHDFFISRNDLLILISNKRAYEYNPVNGKLTPITPFTAFDNIGYLKRSKRLLALTNVGLFHSTDMGHTWFSAVLKGYENFQSLRLSNGFVIHETADNIIYLNVIFNERPAIFRSVDGGKSFYVQHDSILRQSKAVSFFNNEIYMVDSSGYLNRFDSDTGITRYPGLDTLCGFSGIQQFGSGLILWNNRAEFYRFNISPEFDDKMEKIVCFPNPLGRSNTLNLILPKNIGEKLKDIELYDLFGRKKQNIEFEFLAGENMYRIKNMPTEASQLYFLKILTFDSGVYNKKIIVL